MTFYYQTPPSPNELLSKGYRFTDIKASAHASHKTHACISLKQRGYSRNYGLVCNLGKQMAERQGFISCAIHQHSANTLISLIATAKWIILEDVLKYLNGLCAVINQI